jgi:hypothetical protein
VQAFCFWRCLQPFPANPVEPKFLSGLLAHCGNRGAHSTPVPPPLTHPHPHPLMHLHLSCPVARRMALSAVLCCDAVSLPPLACLFLWYPATPQAPLVAASCVPHVEILREHPHLLLVRSVFERKSGRGGGLCVSFLCVWGGGCVWFCLDVWGVGGRGKRVR